MRIRRFAYPLLAAWLLLPALAGAAAKPGETAAPKNAGVVNINTASVEQVALLPRVGTRVAQRIVDYRKANGSFKRIEDLMEVKGIGEKQFTSLKVHLSLTGPTTLTEKIKSTGIRGRSRSARPAKKA